MSSLIEERLLKEIASLKDRLSHLETAEGGVADAILNGLIPYAVGWDFRATAWNVAAGAGTWETDPALSVAIATPDVATLLCIGFLAWRSDTVAAASVDFRCWLDGATAGDGVSNNYLGNPTVNYWTNVALVNRFATVAAGNHTVTFRTRRFNAGHAVRMTNRALLVVAIEE